METEEFTIRDVVQGKWKASKDLKVSNQKIEKLRPLFRTRIRSEFHTQSSSLET